jgi:hypothetical protein
LTDDMSASLSAVVAFTDAVISTIDVVHLVGDTGHLPRRGGDFLGGRAVLLESRLQSAE